MPTIHRKDDGNNAPPLADPPRRLVNTGRLQGANRKPFHFRSDQGGHQYAPRRLSVFVTDDEKTGDAATDPCGADPGERRRNRMADIQQFKNERIVGEGHDGLLTILKKPEGEYGDYVRVTVEEENADRMQLMKSLAENQKTSLPEIQSKQAELWRNRSFKGEWIETQQPDGSWKWVQKEG
jgi:uncharacterized protein YdbL (DUF1318 family)